VLSDRQVFLFRFFGESPTFEDAKLFAMQKVNLLNATTTQNYH
jgi:hypothetical protein